MSRGVDLVPPRTARWIKADRVVISGVVAASLLGLAFGYFATEPTGLHLVLMVTAAALALVGALAVLLDAHRVLSPRSRFSGLGYMLAAIALAAAGAWYLLLIPTLGTISGIYQAIQHLALAVLCLYGWRRVTLAPEIEAVGDGA